MVDRSAGDGTDPALSASYEILYACPACGGRSLETVADSTSVQRQVEALWSFHTRRVRGDTPPYRLVDRSAFSQRPPLAIVACTACGTLVRNPREDADTLRDVYADDDPDAATVDALLTAQRPAYAAQAARLSDVLGRSGTVLEVGCYTGGFLDAAQARGWTAHGLDVNAAAVERAQERGLTATVGDIREVDDTRRYDAVVFWNVFEQIDEPAAALAAAHARLTDRGVLAVRVPNGAFYRRLVNLPAFLRAPAGAVLAWNNLLGFPYRHGFTVTAIEMLLAHEGLRTARVHGDALVRVSDTYTRGWARLEEAALKTVLRHALPHHAAPWLEVYAQ